MLCDHYNHYFSYGVVVYLCVARNKRSLSSLRYKGVAKSVFRKLGRGTLYDTIQIQSGAGPCTSC